MPGPTDLPGNEVRMTPLIPSLDWPGWLQQTVFVRAGASPPAPPAPTAVVVNEDGVSGQITFSRAVTSPSGTLLGVMGSLAQIDFGATGETLAFAVLTGTITLGQTGTAAYSPLNGEIVAVDDGTQVAQFVGLAVTNNSTVSQTAPAPASALAPDGEGGVVVLVTFDKALHTVGDQGFAVTVNGSPVEVVACVPNWTAKVARLVIASAAADGDTILVSYAGNPPGTVTGVGPAFVAVEAFSDLAVTNLMGGGGGPPPP